MLRFFYISSLVGLILSVSVLRADAQERGELISGGVRRVEKAADSLLRDSTVKRGPQSPIFKDSISISRMAAISFVAPGFSQLYNKQYWKIPVLYAGVGTLTYLYLDANKDYKSLRSQYNEMKYGKIPNTPQSALDPVQKSMIRANTQRQLLFMGAAMAYIYFIGDGVVNYPNQVHPVKKATTLAMIFPGAGQIYNKSYWKVPIVLGAFATMGYVIDFNSRGYNRFKEAYNRYPNDEFGGRVTQQQLQNLRDNYRRNRDLSIIATCGLYVLSVVEAHVDAYLKDYDISDDLSMRIEPTMINLSGLHARNSNVQGFGMALRLNF